VLVIFAIVYVMSKKGKSKKSREIE